MDMAVEYAWNGIQWAATVPGAPDISAEDRSLPRVRRLVRRLLAEATGHRSDLIELRETIHLNAAYQPVFQPA